ncbi:MAG: NYN domain-containing protein [Actinobacteria bacterium]|nr:NYN domain-containing protein [Actinomycetota bacterium]
MKDLYIVDGYNFIFNYYKAKKPKNFRTKKISNYITNDDLNYLREKLVRDLTQYKNYTGCSLIVVFDAKKSANLEQNKQKIDSIEVIYSKSGQTADSVVEKLVYGNEKFERIFVVTSDYMQQKVVFRQNVYRKSIREFSIELDVLKKKIREKLKIYKQDVKKSFYLIEKRVDKKTRDRLEAVRKMKAQHGKYEQERN